MHLIDKTSTVTDQQHMRRKFLCDSTDIYVKCFTSGTSFEKDIPNQSLLKSVWQDRT